SKSWAASPNRRSGTNGTHATRASCEPSREGTSTMPPRSGGSTRSATSTPIGRRSLPSAASRRAESWLPGMATTRIPASCRRRNASNTSSSASGGAARCSYTSPASSTASTPSSRAIPTTRSRAAANSSLLERPRIAFPTCQSAVCRNLTGEAYGTRPTRMTRVSFEVLLVAEALEHGLTLAGRRLVGTRRPRRERKADLQRHRDVRLLQDHRPGLEDGGARARHRRKEPVLAPLRLRGVEPPHHPERAVRDDPALHLARGLLGADQDHPERAPALGHIEEHLLDRAPALARGVAVQLVEHEEREWLATAHPLLVLEQPLDHDAGDESLGPVVEVVDVDDGDLGGLPVDPVALGVLGPPAPD